MCRPDGITEGREASWPKPQRHARSAWRLAGSQNEVSNGRRTLPMCLCGTALMTDILMGKLKQCSRQAAHAWVGVTCVAAPFWVENQPLVLL